MRESGGTGDFQGEGDFSTHTVLIALDCPEPRRKRPARFCISARGWSAPTAKAQNTCASQKVFKSVVPDPKGEEADGKRPAYYNRQIPRCRAFCGGDYAAAPDTDYRFVNTADVRRARRAHHRGPGTRSGSRSGPRRNGARMTSTASGSNRGAIAGQKYAEEFPQPAAKGHQRPQGPRGQMAGRGGLLEACLSYINETKPGDALARRRL